MKINTASIEGYAEMTAEEKLAALESYEYDDKSNELNTLNKELGRYKEAITKANSEAKQWKDKHNALLSDEEKAKEKAAEEYEAMQSELKTLKQEKQISDFAGQYISLGYDKELALETATAQANGDFQKMMQNHSTFLASQMKVMQEQALKKQPDLSAGTPPTKEQIENAELDAIIKAAML